MALLFPHQRGHRLSERGAASAFDDGAAILVLSGLTEKFNWQWYYYFLTNEGIDYLREVLHLPLSGFQNLELLNKTLLSFKAEGPFIRMMMFTETSLQFEMEDRWEAELGYFGDEEGSRVVQNPWIATSYMCQQICAFRTLISFYVVEVVALRTTV